MFHHNTLPIDEKGISISSGGLSAGEDIFVEVSHGPTLIDNNLFLSERAAKLPAQGIAFVHNLIAGSFTTIGIGTENGAKTKKSSRYTPYHVQHETEIAGFMTFLHGDMKFYNNIFIQQSMRPAMKQMMELLQGEYKNEWDDGNLYVGTYVFDDEYQTYDEWVKEFDGYRSEERRVGKEC